MSGLALTFLAGIARLSVQLPTDYSDAPVEIGDADSFPGQQGTQRVYTRDGITVFVDETIARRPSHLRVVRIFHPEGIDFRYPDSSAPDGPISATTYLGVIGRLAPTGRAGESGWSIYPPGYRTRGYGYGGGYGYRGYRGFPRVPLNIPLR